MKEGRADFAIPWDIAIGFCTTNDGFYRAIKDKETMKLYPSFVYPPHLVQNGQWIRKPENDDERLICFVFHLRQTMEYLAKHPEGKQSAASTATVAQWISQLPPRHAYARSGPGSYMIHTLDLPPQISGDPLKQRWQDIMTRTHEKYCHLVKQVNSAIEAKPFDQPAPTDERGVRQIAGWGRVGEL